MTIIATSVANSLHIAESFETFFGFWHRRPAPHVWMSVRAASIWVPMSRQHPLDALERVDRSGRTACACRVYSTASSNAPGARPSACAATPGRARSSVIIALAEPLTLRAAQQSGPSTTRQFVEMDLDDGDAPDPHLVLVLADAVARRAGLDDERRDAARAASGLRHREDRVEDATAPPVFHFFSPLMT